MNTVTRDFTVAVFVHWQNKLLLHRHPKIGMWLPPGGHIEANELPDEAAVREVLEEAGVLVRLVGSGGLDFEPEPGTTETKQLIMPLAIQLEHIEPGHEHIDLVYLATPVEPFDGNIRAEEETMAWYTRDELADLPLTREIRAWVKRVYSLL